MEPFLIYLSLSVITLLLIFFFHFRSPRNLPPSPPFPLPLIGHLHLIKQPVHRTLLKLSQKYGDVFSLRFGSIIAVVISSPSAVKECFTKNDIVLANRPLFNSGKHLSYDHTILATSPYGEHWQNLRRISSTDIFSATRLNMYSETRMEEVKRLLRKLCGNYYSLKELCKVEIESKFQELTFNIIMIMVAGKRYYGDQVSDKEEAKRFRDIIKEVTSHTTASNPGDFLPIWDRIDPTGFVKKIKKLGERVDEFLIELIDQVRNQKGECRTNTMIHHLLSLQESQPHYFSDQIIKGLIWVMVLAGTDTTAGALGWALSHLLNNPQVLNKAKTELDSQIGQERLVNETDLSKLSYLQQIIMETLRLNPVPLLLPHCPSQDCIIQGYNIPKNTMVLVNAWAIHQDPKLWEDATIFKPERHDETNTVVVDEHEQYKLLPFGLGRRACPGMGMAKRVIGLTLASIIQCFEWERISNNLVDMTEGNGFTASRVQPLQAMCRPRPIMAKILDEKVVDFTGN